MWCFICKVSLLCSALYATRPYDSVLYMQSVLIILCFMLSVLMIHCLLYTQSVLIMIQCFICKVSL